MATLERAGPKSVVHVKKQLGPASVQFTLDT